MGIKKLSSYFVRYILVIFIFVSCFIFKPSDAYAKSANTLAGLRADLKDLEAQKKANDSKRYVKYDSNFHKRNILKIIVKSINLSISC